MIAGGAIELLFELADLLLERGLRSMSCCAFSWRRSPAAIEPLDVVGDLLLLARKLLGLLLRVLDVALGAARLRLLQLPLRVLAADRAPAAACAPRCLLAVRRRLPHRVGRLRSCRADCVQLRPVLLARELLEPARRLLGLVRELALRWPRSAARACWPSAARRRWRSASCSWRRASSFSFSAARRSSDRHCCCDACWRVSYWFAILSSSSSNKSASSCAICAAAAAAAAALLALHLHLHLVLFFGLLQELQRLLLRRQRAVRA